MTLACVWFLFVNVCPCSGVFVLVDVVDDVSKGLMIVWFDAICSYAFYSFVDVVGTWSWFA